MYFCLKDSVRRRVEGYAALYKTKNRGRRRGEKIQFNSLQMHYTLGQNWERNCLVRDRNTYGANTFLCRGFVRLHESVCGRETKKPPQKAMSSQSIIGNGRFSNLILLIELNPDLGPPLQINWRRAIDVLVGITWLRSAFGFWRGCGWIFRLRQIP